MQGLAAEEAPVVLAEHMAFKLAVKVAVELIAGQMVEWVIAADASIDQQALSKIPIASY